ncbi:uroporphyrinogen III synthase [Halarcobacter ebronensis]|uniref:Uroporphyrinogen-III synthase n=1 Tax=Halarcobacter ebronensis TaxID=1462615 RepID=A0A4Q0YHS0_9BACT|nr:uroporphyrinogen-III synthase [Halarcobacter ebronensis]RXJ70210.1 uroporphyrinogen III synthase [Halarcobacter ebronensis]
MSKIYLLNNQKYEGVENIEVFKIDYINTYIDFSKYDALIFTSKNAVLSLDKISNEWKNVPSFAIAQKTADIIKKLGGKVEFIGSHGHGNDFADELKYSLVGRKALYIRAQKVVSNLVKKLKNSQIDISEVITYKTVCNDMIDTKLEENATIIFTSPSSVECFFNKFEWKETYKAIAIGKTTANYLPEYVKYKISDKTSVDECIKLAILGSF